MSTKKSEAKAESHAQGTCPACGYCPHCGRSNPRPVAPWPYVYPQYPRPYWQWIPGGTFYSGVTASPNQSISGYQNNAISAASVASSN